LIRSSIPAGSPSVEVRRLMRRLKSRPVETVPTVPKRGQSKSERYIAFGEDGSSRQFLSICFPELGFCVRSTSGYFLAFRTIGDQRCELIAAWLCEMQPALQRLAPDPKIALKHVKQAMGAGIGWPRQAPRRTKWNRPPVAAAIQPVVSHFTTMEIRKTLS
jgi:hypothetical protein